MLITMLRGRKRTDETGQSGKQARQGRSTVVDISGPLPQADRRPTGAEGTLARQAIAGPTEMSRLPRELDPFESDFPWIGWTEPRHETFVHSASRSPTFERDLERVLAIFSN